MKILKKVVVMLLVLCMAFSLIACGTENNTSETNSSESETQESTQGTTQESTQESTQGTTQESTQESTQEPQECKHNSGDWITDKNATCSEEGSRHKECIVCKEVMETETIAKLSHTSSDWITDKNATCKEEGSKHKECTACKTTLETETIAKTGHTEVVVAGKAPTKAESGLTDGKKCSVCETVIVAQESIPATGSQGLVYEVNEDGKTCTITGFGTCTDADVYIPAIYDGYSVKGVDILGIDEEVDLSTYKTINIEEGIEWVLLQACEFESADIYLPSTVTKIDFYHTDTGKITFNGSTETLKGVNLCGYIIFDETFYCTDGVCEIIQKYNDDGIDYYEYVVTSY